MDIDIARDTDMDLNIDTDYRYRYMQMYIYKTYICVYVFNERGKPGWPPNRVLGRYYQRKFVLTHGFRFKTPFSPVLATGKERTSGGKAKKPAFVPNRNKIKETKQARKKHKHLYNR